MILEDGIETNQVRAGNNIQFLLWIDGQVVTSQEELIQLAAQERYQGKEFLEAVVLLPLGGG